MLKKSNVSEMIILFTRPANLAMAEWSEFDLDAAEWRIATEK